MSVRDESFLMRYQLRSLSEESIALLGDVTLGGRRRQRFAIAKPVSFSFFFTTYTQVLGTRVRFGG